MFPDKLTLWIVRVCAVIALCVFGYLWVFNRGVAHAEAKQAKADAKAAAITRKAEEALHGVIYSVAYAAEESRIEREKKTAAAIAGLRTGAVIVRPRFQCPRIAATPKAPPGGDGETGGGLLSADVEFLLHEASRADAIADQLGQCQAVVQAYYEATQP